MIDEKIIRKIVSFREKRDWEQYHTPANLAKSLVIESSELLEIFQWSDSNDQLPVEDEQKDRIKEEIADIAIYLLLFCRDRGIDLEEAIEKKLKKNKEKYPVEKSRGKSEKYNKLDNGEA